MRVDSRVTLGAQWARQFYGFAANHARRWLSCPRGFTRLRIICLIAFFSFFFAPPVSRLNQLAAQTKGISSSAQPVPQGPNNLRQQTVIRITVNLVQVDAVVTDSKGHQVTNLQPQDFEILEDGHPQTITNFSYISTATPGSTKAQAAAPLGAPSVPPVRLQPDQVRRSIVILVDDLHMTFEDMVNVRKALNKFIDDDVQPNDLVAILYTSGGIGVRQQFTSDKRVLHADVNALRYRMLGGWEWASSGNSILARVTQPPSGFINRDRSELEGVRKDFAVASGDENQNATNAGTLDALAYVLGGLRDLPGRKAVFLMSDGISIGAPDLAQERMRELADLANRAAAVVYTVGTQGLQTLSPGASPGPAPSDIAVPQWLAYVQESRLSSYVNSQWPLRYLAEKTEGLFLHDNNDLAGGMHKMMDDLRGYYLIGFKPPADAFKTKPGHGFHHIQIKVKVRGLHVRSRPGFYAVPDSNAGPAHRTRQEQLRAAAMSPFTTSDVGLQLAPQFLTRGKKELARLWLHIDARDLSFQGAPGGKRKGKADLMAIAFGDNGVMASGVEGTIKGSFPPAKFEALQRRGVNYTLDLPIKQPGGYQVRVAVLDQASQKLGSASRFIEIPRLNPHRLALSGIVLDPKDLGESGPAVRRLKAGSRLSYQLEIYNARLGGPNQALDLEIKMEIFRGNQLAWEQKPIALKQVPRSSNPPELSGSLLLSPNMPPGHYVLLVTVTDKLAPQRHATARRWIDFQVVPAETHRAG